MTNEMEPVASASQPIESASADENGAIAIIEDSEPIVKKSRKTYSVQFKMNALEKLKQVRANGENAFKHSFFRSFTCKIHAVYNILF